MEIIEIWKLFLNYYLFLIDSLFFFQKIFARAYGARLSSHPDFIFINVVKYCHRKKICDFFRNGQLHYLIYISL